MAAAAPGATTQSLPRRDAETLSHAKQLYEQKQWDRGLRATEQVLKKHPQHGESLAVKGLLLNCLGRTAEAHSYVKDGLRYDLRNTVCWHIYGLLHRSEGNYSEAVKCYLQALRLDPTFPEHMGERSTAAQVLRDVATLQVHVRDWDGFLESRKQMLAAFPKVNLNWMGYVFANFMLKRYDDALRVIDQFLRVDEPLDPPSDTDNGINPNDHAYAVSDMNLFHVHILRTAGRLQAANAHLDVIKPTCLDLLAWDTARGEIALLTANYDEARVRFAALLARVPDNYEYHRGFQAAVLGLDASLSERLLALKGTAVPANLLPLSARQLAALDEAYDALARDHQSTEGTVARVRVHCTRGDVLKKKVIAFIAKGIRRGAPTLFSDVVGLCALATLPQNNKDNDQNDLDCTEDTGQSLELQYPKDEVDMRTNDMAQYAMAAAQEMLDNLRTHGTLTPSTSTAPDTPAGNPDDPHCLLWAMYFMAQAHEARGELADALRCINECIEYTPTAVEMYQRKARILKRCGDLEGAARMMDNARKLDLADRFVNNKATKYKLRAQQIEDGMATIAMFTKHEGDPQALLLEMQVMWYELELGESYARAGRLGYALRQFSHVMKHFQDFYDDQLEYHSYMLKKRALRTYVSLIDWTDNLHAEDYYQQAARHLVRCYLHILDHPECVVPEDPDAAGATAESKASDSGDSNADPETKEASAAAARSSNNSNNNSRKGAKKGKKGKGKKGGSSRSVAQQQRKKQKEEEEKKNQAEQAGTQKDSAEEGSKAEEEDPLARPRVEEPDGASLTRKDALAEAATFCAELVAFGNHHPETHRLNYEVSMRRGKHMMALRSLVYTSSKNDPFMHTCIVDFACKRRGEGIYATAEAEHSLPALDPVSQQVLDSELDALLSEGGTAAGTVPDVVARMRTRFVDDPDRLTLASAEALARAMVIASPTEDVRQQAAALIAGLNLESMRGARAEHCADMLFFLCHDLAATNKVMKPCNFGYRSRPDEVVVPAGGDGLSAAVLAHARTFRDAVAVRYPFANCCGGHSDDTHVLNMDPDVPAAAAIAPASDVKVEQDEPETKG